MSFIDREFLKIKFIKKKLPLVSKQLEMISI